MNQNPLSTKIEFEMNDSGQVVMNPRICEYIPSENTKFLVKINCRRAKCLYLLYSPRFKK